MVFSEIELRVDVCFVDRSWARLRRMNSELPDVMEGDCHEIRIDTSGDDPRGQCGSTPASVTFVKHSCILSFAR